MEKLNQPFFIVGCGRSGTSLLRAILNNHRDIAIPTESLFITDYLKACRKKKLRELICLLIKEPEIREWGIELDENDFEKCRNLVEVIDLCHLKYADIKGKKIWGQKTPRFVRELDLLASNFPEARFIHLIRDPRAVVESLIRSNVHRSNAYFGALRWNTDVQHGLDFEEKYPDKVFRVHYEDLVKNSESTIKSILDFLKLPDYQESISAGFAGVEEYSKFYKKIHANLNRKLSTEFIDSWQERLSAEDIEIVESITRKQMLNLGYQPVTSKATTISAGKIAVLRSERFKGLLKQLFHYTWYRPRYLYRLVLRKWKLGLLGNFFRAVNY
ncbi:MAG TPA: sulfotransferase [Proteobacteria bacterium]|nr:sulfotransferase [Pseudomonadota bacterium]